MNLDCEVYLRGCDRCKGTGRIAEERMGICRACGEWTSLAESCCGAQVLIDGAWCEPDEDDDRDPADINPEPPNAHGCDWREVRNENGSHK